jgi:hypothetical protein
LSTVPYLHSSSTSTSKANDSLFKPDSVPWIGIDVIITKLGNPYKGYAGVVKDVLPRQDTVSGLKISVQLTHLDPSSPYRTIFVDYYDVVEQR